MVDTKYSGGRKLAFSFPCLPPGASYIRRATANYAPSASLLLPLLRSSKEAIVLMNTVLNAERLYKNNV